MELPVAFLSRQFQRTEKRYSVTELESLAIVAAVNYFDYFLKDARVTVYTDHKACEALLSGSKLNNGLGRMALKLKEKEIAIVYKPGKSKGNADGGPQQTGFRRQ